MKMKKKKKARRSAQSSEGIPAQATNVQVDISAAEEELMHNMQQRVGGAALGGADSRTFFRQLGRTDRAA